MKPTYDAYSKWFAALRAAIIPLCLSLISSLGEAYPLVEAEKINKTLNFLFSVLFVAALEGLFIYAGKKLNAHEIKERLKEIERSVARLEECLPSSEPGHARKIKAKIKKLKAEQLELIAR